MRFIPPGLEDAPPRVRRAMAWSAADGTLFAIMDGLSGPALGLYAVALGMPDLVVGLLGSLPWLAGSLSQLLSPWLERLCVTRKRAILLSGLVHMLAWILVPCVEFLPTGLPRAAMLVGIACLGSAGWLVGVPLWASWMGDLLPPLAREKCMAWRAMPAQIGMAAGILVMGEWMQAHDGIGSGAVHAFRILFWSAAGVRLGSLACILLQYEPPAAETQPERDEASRSPAGFGRVALFFAVFHLVLFVGAPYANPYLRMSGLSYREISWILAISFPARMLFLPAWARVAARYGSRRVILVSGALTSLSGSLWAGPGGWAYLMAIQVFAGMAWAGMELCEIPYLLTVMPARDRTRKMAAYFSLRSFTDCLGALGGDLSMGRVRAWGSASGTTPYRCAFALSGLGRAAAMLLAWKSLPETAPQAKSVGPGRMVAEVATLV